MCIFKEDFLSPFYTFIHQYLLVVTAHLMHTTPWEHPCYHTKKCEGYSCILEDPFFMPSITETEVSCVTMLLLTFRKD